METRTQISTSHQIYGNASFRHRLLNMASSALLFVYGIMSLTKGEMTMPGVSDAPYFVIYGPAMWIMLLAFFFLIISLMTVVVSFHDSKSEPIHYQNLAASARKAGFLLLALSLFLHYFVFTEAGML